MMATQQKGEDIGKTRRPCCRKKYTAYKCYSTITHCVL